MCKIYSSTSTGGQHFTSSRLYYCFTFLLYTYPSAFTCAFTVDGAKINGRSSSMRRGWWLHHGRTREQGSSAGTFSQTGYLVWSETPQRSENSFHKVTSTDDNSFQYTWCFWQRSLKTSWTLMQHEDRLSWIIHCHAEAKSRYVHIPV